MLSVNRVPYKNLPVFDGILARDWSTLSERFRKRPKWAERAANAEHLNQYRFGIRTDGLCVRLQSSRSHLQVTVRASFANFQCRQRNAHKSPLASGFRKERVRRVIFVEKRAYIRGGRFFFCLKFASKQRARRPCPGPLLCPRFSKSSRFIRYVVTIGRGCRKCANSRLIWQMWKVNMVAQLDVGVFMLELRLKFIGLSVNIGYLVRIKYYLWCTTLCVDGALNYLDVFMVFFVAEFHFEYFRVCMFSFVLFFFFAKLETR